MKSKGWLVGAVALLACTSAHAQAQDDHLVEYIYCLASSPDAVYVSDVQAVTAAKPLTFLSSAWSSYVVSVDAGATGGYCRGGVFGKLEAYAARDNEARGLLTPRSQQRPVYTSWIG